MTSQDWSQIQVRIMQFEQEGLVTRTFRRLDPERQQAVVDAILAEATFKGPTSLRVKEVARRAEVSVGSLYQYFGNRSGLLDFAVALCVRYMLDLLEQFGPLLSELPLRDALRYYLMGGIEWGQTEAGLVRFIGRAAYQGDPALADSVVRPVADRVRNLVMSLLSEAAGRGEIRPDVDLEATARTINALMLAVGDARLFPYLNIYLQVSDDQVPFERVVDALLEVVMNGISA